MILVENEEHCDVKRLRRCLIQNNILDLIETTHFKHYEYYRLHRLMKASFIETIDSSMISIVDALKNHHNQIHQDFQRREQILQQQCAEKVQQEEKKCNEKQKEVKFELDNHPKKKMIVTDLCICLQTLSFQVDSKPVDDSGKKTRRTSSTL